MKITCSSIMIGSRQLEAPKTVLALKSSCRCKIYSIIVVRSKAVLDHLSMCSLLDFGYMVVAYIEFVKLVLRPTTTDTIYSQQTQLRTF